MPIDLDELERLEREAPRLQPWEWQPQDFLTTPQRGRFLREVDAYVMEATR